MANGKDLKLFARVAVLVILLCPMGLTLAWGAYLYRVGRIPLTGDEPHYLLTTDSIVHDWDLDVRNNYEQDAAKPMEDRILQVDDWRQHTAHLQKRGDGLYNRHEPGLSALMAVPYALYGVPGTKAAMIFLLGLAPFLFFWVARRIVKHAGWAAAIALTLSLGMPLSLASVHVYTDALAGLLVLYAIENLYREYKEGPSKSSAGRMLLTGLVLFLLPWLKVPFLLPAGLCTLATVYVQLRKGLRRQTLGYAALGAAFPLLGFVLFALYLKTVFGGVTHSSAGLTTFGWRAVYHFLQMHVGLCRGILLHQPFLLVGVVGLWSLWRRDWRFALSAMVLYLSLIGPNATIALADGFRPGTRYAWSSFPLWIYPICALFATLSDKGRRGFGLLCVAALFVQAALAFWWVPEPLNTYHPRSVPSVFSWQSNYFAIFTSRQPNLPIIVAAWTGLVMLLAAWGLFWHRASRRNFGVLISVYVVLAFLWMHVSVQNDPKEVWEAESLPMQAVATKNACTACDEEASEGLARSCDPETTRHQPFCLAYGPFSKLLCGQAYKVDFYLKAADNTSGHLYAVLDIVHGPEGIEVAREPVFAKDFKEPLKYQPFTLIVRPSMSLRMVQYRVNWTGEQQLWVDRIEVKQVKQQPKTARIAGAPPKP